MFISTLSTLLHLCFVVLFIPPLQVCQKCNYVDCLTTCLNQNWLAIQMLEHLYCKSACTTTCQLAQPHADLHSPHADLHHPHIEKPHQSSTPKNLELHIFYLQNMLKSCEDHILVLRIQQLTLHNQCLTINFIHVQVVVNIKEKLVKRLNKQLATILGKWLGQDVENTNS